jgi:hypothetical protein
MIALIAPASASALYIQCPPAGLDRGCQYLIMVTDSGATVARDPSQRPYEGAADSLIGVQNNSSRAVQSLRLTASSTIFEFDGDGLCNNARGPAPAGCQPPPGSSASCNPSTVSTNHCSFPPPPGEPPGYTEPGATNYAEEHPPNTPVPAPWPGGELQNGYEGPGTWFSNVTADLKTGSVNFSPALLPGQTTYFSLEEPNSVVSAVVNVPPVRTSISLRLSGDGLTGSRLTVPQGAAVVARAQISGARSGTANGMINYAFFLDKACANAVGVPSSAPVSNGGAAPSSPARLAPGRYYVRATYNGDALHSPSASRCGTTVVVSAIRFVSSLPSNRSCLGSRTLRFRLRAPKGIAARGAVIELGGRRVMGVRFGRKPPLIVLRHLPAGRFHIALILTARDGRIFEDSRIYHLCAGGSRSRG